MAVQSKQLSPQDPDAIAAVRRARPPRRPFWIPFIRLLLQHAVTTPIILAAAPLIILKNIFPFLRKHPLWSFKSAVFNELIRLCIICMGLIRFAPIPNKENGWRETSILAPLLQVLSYSSAGSTVMADSKTLTKLKVKAKRLDRVWFDPPPVEYLQGILSVRVPGKEHRLVSSPLYKGRAILPPHWAKARCRAFWYMRKAGLMPPLPSDPQPRTRPVMLYIHGGAGVSFAAGDIFMGETLVKNMARTAEIDILSLDYDLAPHGAYPTTTLQALGAWLYLTKELHYDPSQIYIGGDSYGAFATLAFNRYMRDVYPLVDPEATGGKPPATPGLALYSPWLTQDNDAFPSRQANVKYDIITMAYANWGLDGLGIGPWCKSNTFKSNDVWISPVDMSLEEMKELPALFVTNGGIETLLDEGKLFVQKARKAGLTVEHVIEVGIDLTSSSPREPADSVSSLQPGQTHDFGTNPAEVAAAKKHYRRMKTWIANIEAKRPQA